jgi:hypothetical protein
VEVDTVVGVASIVSHIVNSFWLWWQFGNLYLNQDKQFTGWKPVYTKQGLKKFWKPKVWRRYYWLSSWRSGKPEIIKTPVLDNRYITESRLRFRICSDQNRKQSHRDYRSIKRNRFLHFEAPWYASNHRQSLCLSNPPKASGEAAGNLSYGKGKRRSSNDHRILNAIITIDERGKIWEYGT